ncbi:MAG: bifunctional phosphopantothenoylcysteine decarboxylase/phosphopantothenate--cysteine ligase CoaBC [Cyanobacteria bacterium K_Offshore_surface_m2_011]|nr:bifunctional phosphopantothenoylcysteine decarboxylase/phosphopantothenate--cysteine ligase CoaBC [Cyanobacteria bacterium K_Offshore_surface_m2_011]
MRSEGDALAGRRVLVLISGSIAAVKLPQLVSALVQRGALVRCVLSPGAERLVSAVALASLSRAPCHIEADQWSHQESRPLHIALAEWAEVVLLAPLSATSLARWVHGMADTLLASTLIACEAPVVAAPAMNSAMWAAPAVRRNWRELQGWERVLPLDPGSGLLACDRVGDGRMADPELLLLALESLLVAGCRRDWRGRRLLVSAGPTREALDPARCLTNPSTGRMGVLLAQAARLRGATVDLVHGPLAVDPAWLEGLQCHPVVTAAEMEAALLRLQDGADAIAMAAAVADHRRRSPEGCKLPKEALEASLTSGWEPVPDLLAALVRRRPQAQAILGFAAQSGEVLQEARAKFARKGCDLLFANPIDRPGAGFGAAGNEGWLLGPGERESQVGPTGKLALAHRLLSALAEAAALRAPARAPADP